MIRHIFLDKTATIVKGLHVNTGLNPVAELNYGESVTRILLHFDEAEIRSLFEDGTIPEENKDKVKITLKMTNTAGIDGIPYEKPLKFGNTCITKERAVSFTVLALELPCNFDEGRGFEYISDVWITNNKSYSTDGCNWFQCYNGKLWNEEGVYSPLTIKEEYDKFDGGEESLVIDRQRFDFGDENLQIDITKYVMDVLFNDKPNNGILLCFSPLFEVLNGVTDYREFKGDFDNSIVEYKEYTEMPSLADITVPEYFKVLTPIYDDEGEIISYTSKCYKRLYGNVKQQYVGFFTDHTNTFFHPYVEVDYREYIQDDRASFYPGKENKLYLFSNIGGKPENLDEMPTCTFEGAEYEVKQATKGTYYIEVSENLEPDKICYDVWSNLVYNGIEQDDVELETVVLPKSGYFQIGSTPYEEDNVVPSLYGINDDEGVKKGDIRKVVVDYRKKYTTNERQLVSDSYYRLYVMNGEQEIDILNGYQPVERAFLQNYFILHTSDLIPNKKYYVDIKTLSGHEVKYFKNVLHFKIVDDVTERYV